MRVTRRNAILHTGTEMIRSRSIRCILAVVPMACLVLATPAMAESVACGLGDPDVPIPGSSVRLDDTPAFLNNVSPAVVTTSVALNEIGFSCAASISTLGPSIRASIQGSPAFSESLQASGGELINYNVSMLQAGGPGGNIPIIAQLLTTITYDPVHTRTTGSMSIFNSFPMTTNPDGTTGANQSFSHIMNSLGSPGCSIAAGGCTFNDTLYGAAAVGAQFYNFNAGIGAFFDGVPANGNVFADPIFMVDPNATFGEGLRYANFYEVVMPANITQAVIPVPAALPLFGSALAGFSFIGWRRRPLFRHITADSNGIAGCW
jgi:hypothetical protein